MKKNIVKVALVAAISMVCVTGFLNSQKSETLSEVALANVEALAAVVPEGCEAHCYSCEGWMCGIISNGETTRCMNHRKKVQ